MEQHAGRGSSCAPATTNRRDTTVSTPKQTADSGASVPRAHDRVRTTCGWCVQPTARRDDRSEMKQAKVGQSHNTWDVRTDVPLPPPQCSNPAVGGMTWTDATLHEAGAADQQRVVDMREAHGLAGTFTSQRRVHDTSTDPQPTAHSCKPAHSCPQPT